MQAYLVGVKFLSHRLAVFSSLEIPGHRHTSGLLARRAFKLSIKYMAACIVPCYHAHLVLAMSRGSHKILRFGVEGGLRALERANRARRDKQRWPL